MSIILMFVVDKMCVFICVCIRVCENVYERNAYARKVYARNVYARNVYRVYAKMCTVCTRKNVYRVYAKNVYARNVYEKFLRS